MIPTCNQAAYVARAVDSALAQDYERLEIIVSDDASSDETPDVLKAYAGHPAIRLYRNERNLGRVPHYRTNLYERATGEWAINLDGDDHFVDHSFIRQAVDAVCKAPGIVMACGQVRKREGAITMNAGLPPVIDGRKAFLRKYPNFYHFHAGALYRRSLAMGIGFYEHNIVSSDQESLRRLSLHGRIAVIPVEAACWNVTGDNASLSLDVHALIDNIQADYKPYCYAKDHKLIDAEDLDAHFFDMLYRHRFQAYRLLNNRKDAVGYDAFMAAIKSLCPAAYWKIALKPKYVFKRLALGLNKGIR